MNAKREFSVRCGEQLSGSGSKYACKHKSDVLFLEKQNIDMTAVHKLYCTGKGKEMETYDPNNYPRRSENNQYQNPDTVSYDNNYYYGSGQTTQGQGNFTGMNTGFDQSGVSGMSGFQNLNKIAAHEVVAKSFLFMVVGLLITAVASLTTSPAVAIRMLTGNGFIILLFAELGIVLVSNWAVARNNAILAGVLFAAYSYLTGVTCSVLFLVYTGSSIAVIFFATAAMFAIMAVIGLVTKKDLTSMGNLLLMALIGILIVSLVNRFWLKSGGTDLVICVVGVLVFVGLTAYDAQKIKHLAAVSSDSNVLTLALMGAFQLYLDFINIFLKLLRLFGKRK